MDLSKPGAVLLATTWRPDAHGRGLCEEMRLLVDTACLENCISVSAMDNCKGKMRMGYLAAGHALGNKGSHGADCADSVTVRRDCGRAALGL